MEQRKFSEPFLMRIPPGLKNRIRESADAQGRSMASLMVGAAEAYLATTHTARAAGPEPLSGEPPRTGGPALPVVVSDAR